jgi:cardiolipin synthase (CMP-forming)
MIINLPNLLTLSRIVLIPAFVAAFYLSSPLSNWVSFGIFAVAGVTDFFDGYLARNLNQVSKFGRFLDPIADKLLVAAAILMLVAVDRIAGWTVLAALVILCREILVSGLREFLAEAKVSVPVSQLAKWKTGVQIVALGFLLVGNAANTLLPAGTIGVIGLWIAAILTLYTGYDYMRVGLRHMAEP